MESNTTGQQPASIPLGPTDAVDPPPLPTKDPKPTTNDPQRSTRDPFDEIKRFRPTGSENNKAGYSVPAYCLLALEMTVARLKPFDISNSRVGLWAFTKGIRQLVALPDVKKIVDTRSDLLKDGSNVNFLDWHYSLSNRGAGSVRLYFRYVDLEDTAKASKVREPRSVGHCAA